VFELMSASYLIRIDDICPTIKWNLWNRYEEILMENNILPMLAVIPDNKDSRLFCDPPDRNFWDRVRAWQKRGWTIGLHGYQHVYTLKSRGMVGLQDYSEFAGLPYERQYQKLEAAVAIFRREGVNPDLWIAPNHSFDNNTIRALVELGVSTICDGYQLYPYLDSQGVFWIPQQLGNFHKMPVGLWTICIHLDDPLHANTEWFKNKLESFRPFIVSVGEVVDQFARHRASFLNDNFARVLRGTKRTALSLNKIF
jgi:predicted deacetylase